MAPWIPGTAKRDQRALLTDLDRDRHEFLADSLDCFPRPRPDPDSDPEAFVDWLPSPDGDLQLTFSAAQSASYLLQPCTQLTLGVPARLDLNPIWMWNSAAKGAKVTVEVDRREEDNVHRWVVHPINTTELVRVLAAIRICGLGRWPEPVLFSHGRRDVVHNVNVRAASLVRRSVGYEAQYFAAIAPDVGTEWVACAHDWGGFDQRGRGCGRGGPGVISGLTGPGWAPSSTGIGASSWRMRSAISSDHGQIQTCGR